MTAVEKTTLSALRYLGAHVPVADLAEHLAVDRKNLSSRLCEFRKRGLVQSEDGADPHGRPLNLWTLTEAGLAKLQADPPPAQEIALASPENPPAIAEPDADTAPTDQLDEPDGADDVNPALVQESMHIIRPVAPFHRINDALFVLETLAIAYCHHLPAYQKEIERITDYLREAAA